MSKCMPLITTVAKGFADKKSRGIFKEVVEIARDIYNDIKRVFAIGRFDLIDQLHHLAWVKFSIDSDESTVHVR